MFHVFLSNTGCLNIHETALLFLLTQNMYMYAGCFNIYGNHGTANNSTNNKVVCFFLL